MILGVWYEKHYTVVLTQPWYQPLDENSLGHFDNVTGWRQNSSVIFYMHGTVHQQKQQICCYCWYCHILLSTLQWCTVSCRCFIESIVHCFCYRCCSYHVHSIVRDVAEVLSVSTKQCQHGLLLPMASIRISTYSSYR